MTVMWPYLSMKTGGIKRGELVVIGAFSKKDNGMYQIQVRRYDSEVWTNWRRPWLTKEAALAAMSEVETSDELSCCQGTYVYQIVEV